MSATAQPHNNTGEAMDRRAFLKMTFSLVLPMAVQNLINTAITSADVMMLGKVGETALSASSLAGQVQFIMNLIFFGLTSGAAVLTAQYWGKQDIRTIEKVLGISLRFSFLVASVFTAAALLFPRYLMMMFSSEEPVIAEGVKYLRMIAVSYIPVSFSMVFLNLMRSVERVVISTMVYLFGLFCNVGLNAVFIFGLLGFPAMGVSGAALATLITRLLELVIVLVYSQKNPVVRFRIKDIFVRDKLLFKDFLQFSIPVTINEMMWGLGTSVNAMIIGHMGSTVVAANSVAQVIRQLAMVVAFGLANATAIVIGKAIGENKYEAAKIYARRFLKLTLLFGACGSALILAIGPVVGSFLTLSGDAQGYLNMMMLVMSYFSLAQGYNTTMIVGIFRAGGDTKFGLFCDVGSLWCCSILFGYLCAFVFRLPVTVVYMVLMSDEIIKIPLTTWRYKSKLWLRNVTR